MDLGLFLCIFGISSVPRKFLLHSDLRILAELSDEPALESRQIWK